MQESQKRPDFGELYETHKHTIWAVGYRYCKNADLANDVVQDVFLKLWKIFPTVEKPVAWLVKAARNRARDLLKSSFYKNGTTDIFGDIEQKTEIRRDTSFMAEAIARLRTKDRNLILWRYFEKMTTPQLLKKLKIDKTQFYTRLGRARIRLKEILGACLD